MPIVDMEPTPVQMEEPIEPPSEYTQKKQHFLIATTVATVTRGSRTTPFLKMWFAFSLRRIGGKSSSGGDMHAAGQMTCGVSSACRWRQQDPHRCTNSTARPVRMMLDVARGKHELSMKSKHFLRIQQILKCGVDSRLNDLFHPGLSSVYQLIQLQAKKFDRFSELMEVNV